MLGVRNQKEQITKRMIPCKSLVKVKLTYGIESQILITFGQNTSEQKKHKSGAFWGATNVLFLTLKAVSLWDN